MSDNLAVKTDATTTLGTLRTLEDASNIHWPAGVCVYATTVGTPDVLQVVTPTAGLPVQPQTGSTWTVDGSGVTQPISAASLPLPSGAATAAKQPSLGTAGSASSNVITIQGITSMTAVKVGGVYNATPPTLIEGDESPVLLDSSSRQVVVVAGTVTVGSHAVTNAGTFAVQVSSALPAGTNAIGKLAANSGVDIGDVDVTSVPTDPFGANADAASATGSISAKLRFIASTGIPITGTVTVGSHAVTNAGTFAVQVDGTALTRLTDIETNTDSCAVVGNGAAATAQRVTLANDSTGIVALTTSTASIGKLASNTGVTIGAVEIASAQTLATVTTVSTLTGGGVAHDSADSGNPVKVGARAALTLSDDTMVANGDRTDNVSDADGALLVRGQFPLGDLLSEAVSNTDGSSTAFSTFGATANTRNYITAIHVFRTDSGTTTAYVDFRDGTGGSVLFRVALPPNGGAVLPASSTPYFRTTANTALAYDVSSALTTVYISVSGFKSKV